MRRSKLARCQRRSSASRSAAHPAAIQQLIDLTSPLNSVTRITQRPDQRADQTAQRKQNHHRPDTSLLDNIPPHHPRLHTSPQHATQQRAPSQHRHSQQQGTRPRHHSEWNSKRQARTKVPFRPRESRTLHPPHLVFHRLHKVRLHHHMIDRVPAHHDLVSIPCTPVPQHKVVRAGLGHTLTTAHLLHPHPPPDHPRPLHNPYP